MCRVITKAAIVMTGKSIEPAEIEAVPFWGSFEAASDRLAAIRHQC